MNSLQSESTGLRNTLSRGEWRELAGAHAQKVHAHTAEYQESRARGERHPVWDFLFHYYPLTVGKLAHWHPGAHVQLEYPLHETPPAPFGSKYYISTEQGIHFNTQLFWEQREQSLRFIYSLLARTYTAAPQFSCFGLHEWAMVYKDTPRHPEPLRLGAEATDAFVQSQKIACSHYDAFRFFTPKAAPLNTLQPTRDTQLVNEQPACLHANMDIYKWAIKLLGVISSDLLYQAFDLAWVIRKLDMQASPYDLSEWGFSPIPIETPQGRTQYARLQKEHYARGQALRQEILEILVHIYPQLANAEA